MKERIRKLRRTLDLTQQEFSERLGIKRNTIANYEAGRNEPTDSVVSLIVKVYNVNETWLRTGEGEMFEEEPPSEIDDLARRFDLTNRERILVERFCGLKPESREAVMNFIIGTVEQIIAETHEERTETHEFVPDPSEATEEEKLAAYQEFLETKKKAEAK